MADQVTEVTQEGWLSRLWNSIVGVLFGGVLFLAGFPLLFWNEGRAVQTAKSLDEGQSQVVTVSADKVDPANEGKLVHMTGQAQTPDTLRDPTYPVEIKAIKLIRNMQGYQWDEDKSTSTRKKVGGGEETVTKYTYKKVWSRSPINDTSFKEKNGHNNWLKRPLENRTMVASTVTVGAFTLIDALKDSIDSEEKLPLLQEHFDKLSPAEQSSLKLVDGILYHGNTPSNPEIGDVKIHFEVVKPTVVSFFAKQVGSSFAPFQTQAGDALIRLDVGTRSAQELFAAAATENTIMTWVLRLVGFLMFFIGVSMVFRPFSVMADVIPFFGNILETGIAFFAFAIAAPAAMGTIAVAWFFYRPLYGILLFAGAIGLIVAMKSMFGAKKA